MTHAEAKAFLLPLVRELTGLLCKWDYQNAPKPNGPHISMRLSSERTTGTETRRRKDGSGILDIVSQKEATLSLDAFGSGVIDVLNMLWTQLQRPTIVDRCFSAGIAILRTGDPQDLTALLDGRRWEERANLDLYVTYSRAVTDDPGYITSVIINGELGEPNQPEKTTDPADVNVTITMKEEP